MKISVFVFIFVFVFLSWGIELGSDPGGWSVGFHRKANRVQLGAPRVHYVILGVCGELVWVLTEGQGEDGLGCAEHQGCLRGKRNQVPGAGWCTNHCS